MLICGFFDIGLCSQDWSDGSTFLHGPLLTLPAGSIGNVIVHNDLSKPVDELFAVRQAPMCTAVLSPSQQTGCHCHCILLCLDL